MMGAGHDVPRMVHRRLAFVAVHHLGVFLQGVHMKRSNQHHRHIDRQHDPGEQPLPAGDAVM